MSQRGTQSRSGKEKVMGAFWQWRKGHLYQITQEEISVLQRNHKVFPSLSLLLVNIHNPEKKSTSVFPEIQRTLDQTSNGLQLEDKSRLSPANGVDFWLGGGSSLVPQDSFQPCCGLECTSCLPVCICLCHLSYASCRAGVQEFSVRGAPRNNHTGILCQLITDLENWL